jgi:hypothetical protein
MPEPMRPGRVACGGWGYVPTPVALRSFHPSFPSLSHWFRKHCVFRQLSASFRLRLALCLDMFLVFGIHIPIYVVR